MSRVPPVCPRPRPESFATRAPQLATFEAHVVTMLRDFLLGGRVDVREDEHAVIAVDDALLVARVARQASVAERVDVSRAYAVADLEARRCEVVIQARCAPVFYRRRHVCGADDFRAARASRCFARRQLLRRDVAELEEQPHRAP